MADARNASWDQATGNLMCDWCGRPTPANYVHGHIQCVHCHRNIAPCCEGEICVAAPPDKAADD